MEKSIRRPIAVIFAVLMAFLLIPVASYGASDTADDIKYSVQTGDVLKFKENDFNKVCKRLNGEELDFVYFDLPSSSKGVLWYDYDGKNEEEVDEDDEYYYDYDDWAIDDVSFVPKKNYTGTVTVSYTGYDVDDNEFTGKIKITVTEKGGEADDLTYTVASDKTVDFDEKDFDDACFDANDEDLDYVTFTLPASSRGVLYLGYDDGDYDSKVSESTKYYYDRDPAIYDITFVPKAGYTGTVTINYKGYDVEGGNFTGSVKIKVDKGVSEDGDINYTVDAGDELNFDEEDFNDFCEDENDETLNFIVFPSLPSSSEGVLWYDYDGRDEEKVVKNEEYYYDDDLSIDDITFIPNEKFSGYVEIEFEGEDMDGDSIEGTIVIQVKNEDLAADDIFLNGTAGSPVLMQDVYFNRACDEILDDTLDYVKFTLPSTSYGTLYYDYKANNGTSLVAASTKYYYEDRSPYLKNVSFVSAGTAAGTYTIKYTGFGADGGSFTGQMKITVTAKTGTGTATPAGIGSQYFSDVTADYSWAATFIDNLYSTGIVKGITATDGTQHYSPASKITRADFLLLLCRALNVTSSTTAGNFSDVAAGSYYYDALAAAKALGIAQGSDNKFNPNAIITREDAMVMALRAMTVTGNSPGAGNVSDLYAYKDYGTVSTYAREGVGALIKAGIITGSDGQLRPKSSLTRAESAAIIYRIKY
ncbi:MAG TPA: S-layer homology domain-containing protein [Anaerovoracaceae bacterium]|nr:S-layer homology domain-containing protein [Anaerovoracaceae bacterium]